MSDKDIEAQVEASSLGTPEAKTARESVSDETAARVVARSWQIEAEDLRAQIRDLLEEREELLTEIRRLRDDGFPLELDEHFREIAARRPSGAFPKEES